MVRYEWVTGLFALTSGAYGLHKTSLPISELAKQVRGSSLNSRQFTADYPEYYLDTPIDHFFNDTIYEPHSNGTYGLRYWFDAQYYKPGGPVIVLGGGETDGAGRLPFLTKGIVYQLSKATNGIGVILEHRYYGESLPTEDFSTENLRFLTTDQALADTAYFAKNVKFAGLEDVDLSPETTPWIAYGGSYAGAFVAILRKLYPEVYWGAISSSGVPEAIYDYYNYFEAAEVYGPPACVETTKKLTNVVDNILIGQANSSFVQQLKAVFGLPNVTYDDDFASAINGGIYGLQSYNWDPEISSDEFFTYCDIVSNDTVIYPATEVRRESATELLNVGGYEAEADALTNRFLNYIGYVNATSVSRCRGDQNACYTAHDTSFYKEDDINQTWRLWPYQYCTQWGYLQTGSGKPEGELPLISRKVDLEYSSIICREAFNITEPSDVEAINKYGGFGLRYERLAYVDGEWDPWRAAGPHAIGLPERESTTSEPFILIAKAVHHWDENGVFPNQTTPDFPPVPVADAQKAEAEFVTAWVSEFNALRSTKNR